MNELRKKFDQETTGLLNENIKTDIFSVKLNELVVLLSSYLDLFLIKEVGLQERESDEVTVHFRDSQDKEGVLKIKFQIKDNLTDLVIISQ